MKGYCELSEMTSELSQVEDQEKTRLLQVLKELNLVLTSSEDEAKEGSIV